MADLEQLKQKYASVLQLIKGRNVRLDNLHVQDGKLFMKGAAPNEAVKNEVWNAIKGVDAGYSDLTADISIDSSIPAPAAAGAAGGAGKTYTVKSGDTLSKIAKQFYGDAGQYMKIFEANRNLLSDPDKIQPGQELSIP
jgi:nucleoid-associated protein YgaU